MVLLILVYFIADILSIAYIFIACYLWREWYKYHNTAADYYARKCLYIGIALSLFILLGKFLVKFLLSKRRSGEEEPHMFQATKSEQIKRPDGTLINIEYYGNPKGQPIIFVHGWNSNIKGWFYQRKYFEKEYFLIMIDLPGLGQSTRPENKDFSLNKMALDLTSVIQHTGVQKPILWGHSIGGMIILTLLAKNKDPNRQSIKGVILEHTTYTNPVHTMILSRIMTAIQKPVLVPLCWILIVLSPVIWISRWFSYLNGNSHIMTRLLTFTGTQSPKQLDFVTLLSTLAPPAVTARGVLGMFKYDVTKQLPEIKEQVLIIAANKDRLTKEKASETMKMNLPNSTKITVVPGGHQGLVERHKEVNEAAAAFIKRISA